MVADQIINHVVTLIGLGEIFFGVIDHVIGADRFHKIDIARAANSRDLRAERFRDLNRESTDAAGRAVDQNFLSGLNVSFVAQTLQCRQPGNGDRTRLFECDVAWFHHDGAIRLDADVIRHGPVFCAENFVAWLEVRYIFSNCFDDAGEVGAEARVLRLAHSTHWPHQPAAPDRVSVDRID